MFYMKWNKFCSTYDIDILLIVACIVMYVSSNHAVHCVVVVLFLNFTMKFHVEIISLCFINFMFLLFSLVYLLLF